MNDSDKIKSRIRKLLCLANDQSAAEGEIENALNFARKLMDKHHLEEGDLTEEQLQEKMAREVATCGGAKMSMWESCLANAVIETVGTIGWYVGKKVPKRDEFGILQRGKGNSQEVAFYGPCEDVSLAIEMFLELSKTVAAMARLRWGGVYRGAGRSYCEGFTSELLGRVRNVVQQQRTEQCRAIVLRSKDAAKLWLKEELGIGLHRRGSSKGRQVTHNSSAWNDGQAHGRDSNLSFTRRSKLQGGSGSTKLLS